MLKLDVIIEHFIIGNVRNVAISFSDFLIIFLYLFTSFFCFELTKATHYTSLNFFFLFTSFSDNSQTVPLHWPMLQLLGWVSIILAW